MTLWCCVTPEREEKTARIMKAMAKGCGGTVIVGPPPDDGNPFVVWGHEFLGAKIVPEAHRTGRPYWFIDNGYTEPAGGSGIGFYSICYRGLWPVVLPNPDRDRNARGFYPWQTRKGGYVLLALPGMKYGGMLGYDMRAWAETIEGEIRAHTGRKIKRREKRTRIPLLYDLNGAAVVVTHSSKVAVDAVISGVPAIVAPTNPAAPVCSTNMADIENPPRPDRAHWWASLMCQQFRVQEMASGLAAYWMDRIRETVDARRAA